MTDFVCSCVLFCRDIIIPSKQIKIYQNNKPWINRSTDDCIQKNRQAHKQGSASDLHVATEELKVEISKAKKDIRLN